MSDTTRADDPLAPVTAWWSTAITRIAPGEIAFRGHRVQDLIGSVDLVSAMALLVRGALPTPGEAALLQATLVASLDHGPQAPSIASARMAATCGVGINSAIANGVNVLGDTHGGAGQQCVAMLQRMVAASDDGRDLADLAVAEIAEHRARGAYVPGFGHRFHPRDPRRDPLLALVERAVAERTVEGRHLRAGLAIEAALADRGIPMNIDGISAIVYAELGMEPELARGFFVLARSVGIFAHAWEEKSGGRRIKGPLPPPLLADYTGEPVE